MAQGVSVVVPTKQRPAALAACLRAILLAAERVEEDVEIIVLDDGDGDDDGVIVREILSRQPLTSGVSVSYVPRRAYGGDGPVRGREYGVRYAQYDIVAFTDDDTVCDADWLRLALERLRSAPELAGLEGAVIPDVRRPFNAVRARVVQSRTGGVFLTANLVLRREAILHAGGFQRLWNERLLTGGVPFREDTDLGLRVRKRVGLLPFDPRLVVQHPIDQPSLRVHVQTARFFALDAPFGRLHPGAIPSLRSAPLARFRIRAACATLGVLPLLAWTRTRLLGALIGTAAVAGVSLQVERDLWIAGLRRSKREQARTAVLRLPRSLLWCLVAGVSRAVGVALVHGGLVRVRGDGAECPPGRA